ncbi:MAG: Iron-binding protein iscA [Candidatus Peregrinibacteria bacterium Greene0416_19]|nr:MAG: Iron-binding protein iscA [Candidatus Peregrinibacteria bacterium Greene0416_19]
MVKARSRMHKQASKHSIRITSAMPVGDIVALLPDAQGLLAEYGLHCAGCSVGMVESLEDGCSMHGIDDAEITELVDDLNTLLDRMPQRPQSLTLTSAAARAIRKVAEKEGRTGQGLVVVVDSHGGFCMEFRQDGDGNERTFTNEEEPDVHIFASTLTLQRIGGSTIDFREGRFKLDLAEDAGSGCACGGSCNCK